MTISAARSLWDGSRGLLIACVLVAATAAGVHVYLNGKGVQPPSRDLHAILGASKSASDEDLKKLFRKLAVKWHPDKATPSQRDEHARIFEDISGAYKILTDPLERRIYDKLGDRGVQRWRDGGSNFRMSILKVPFASESRDTTLT